MTDSTTRYQEIINNSNTIFNIANNTNANANYANSYAVKDVGVIAVSTYGLVIERMSAQYGVDPDLAKSIMYVENAQGHYYGLAAVAESLGIARSIMPMNIRPDIWGSLIEGNSSFNDPITNIEAGVILISKISF